MEPALTDTIVMLAELHVRPDRLSDFLSYTAANLTVSRGYPGNLQFDMLFDPARPATVLFYEVWTSAEAQQAYMAWRTAAGDLETLLGYLTGPPTFTALRSVAA